MFYFIWYFHAHGIIGFLWYTLCGGRSYPNSKIRRMRPLEGVIHQDHLLSMVCSRISKTQTKPWSLGRHIAALSNTSLKRYCTYHLQVLITLILLLSHSWMRRSLSPLRESGRAWIWLTRWQLLHYSILLLVLSQGWGKILRPVDSLEGKGIVGSWEGLSPFILCSSSLTQTENLLMG